MSFIVGNHELDNGIDVLEQRISETNFPWIISNVTDRNTNKPLAHCHRFYTLTRAGIKFGFLGLASIEWLSTMIEMNKDLEYVPFIECARELSKELRVKHSCSFIVALTHMRIGDDVALAEAVPGVDIILGGHDHVVWKCFVNGRWLLKSGTDFKNYSTIDLFFCPTKIQNSDFDGKLSSIFVREPETIDVTSAVEKDEYFDGFCKEKLQLLGEEYFDQLAISTSDLDGRFVSIRTKETELGNFICDAMCAQLRVPIALVNSGSLRSDMLEPAGSITRRTINTVLPFQDETIVVRCTGRTLLSYLENSVSQYPRLDGRFCQVAGVWFSFDPQNDPGKRIDFRTVRCRMEDGRVLPLQQSEEYKIAFKTYMFSGNDGFPTGDPNDILLKCDIFLPSIIVNYLKSLPRREDGGIPFVSPHVEERIVCLKEDSMLKNFYGNSN